jgi:hypothetical protein
MPSVRSRRSSIFVSPQLLIAVPLRLHPKLRLFGNKHWRCQNGTQLNSEVVHHVDILCDSRAVLKPRVLGTLYFPTRRTRIDPVTRLSRGTPSLLQIPASHTRELVLEDVPLPNEARDA